MLIMAVILCVLSIIFIGVNFAYKRTSRYYNECIDIKNYKDDIIDDAKIVCLGSTYSKFAFDGISELKLRAANLSIQAQCLEVDYAILKEYAFRYNDDCIVFICLAACCMLYEGNNNPLYCNILKKKNNPKYSLKSQMISTYPLLKNLKKIKAFIKDDLEYENIYDSIPQISTDDKADDTLKSMAEGWISMFDLPDLRSTIFSNKNQLVMEKNTIVLKNIINYCIEKGYHPVVIIPPFSEKLNQYFSKEFTQKVIDKNVFNACGDNNVVFLNYQWDEEFRYRYDLFKDQGFRLNQSGSIFFIKKVVRDLSDYNIDINNFNCGR